MSALFPDYGTVATIVISSIECLFCLLGLIGIIFRVSSLVKCLETGFEIVLWCAIFGFIFTWIGWIVDLTANKWKPQTDEIIWMVTFCISHIIFFIASYWILGLFKSLAKVISVGGSGWERKNYMEVEDMLESQDTETNPRLNARASGGEKGKGNSRERKSSSAVSESV
eukprot:GHVN01090152.1.p1 GENE.GHVN01090152.1~~GHVN01090152.1.p1  ORF type:complete len:191 (-),score=20.93 GHVN01090152.1:149-655(-)